MTDVLYIYLFFSATLSHKHGKQMLYIDKTNKIANKIANRLILYNLYLFILFSLCNIYSYESVKLIVS